MCMYTQLSMSSHTRTKNVARIEARNRWINNKIPYFI